MKTFQCGKYEVTINRDGTAFEMIAKVTERESASVFHVYRSNIANVNGIMGQLLSDREIESGEFEDSWFDFETESRAKRCFTTAVKLCKNNPEYVEKQLDLDRAEGEWQEVEK